MESAEYVGKSRRVWSTCGYAKKARERMDLEWIRIIEAKGLTKMGEKYKKSIAELLKGDL